MKDNTKKILIWLYPVRNGSRWVSRSELEFLLPNLTPSGFKSLLFLLEKNELIITEKIGEVENISITAYGKKAISDRFPVFQDARRDWKGDWSLISFLNPPKADKNFRNLRRLLLENKAISLTRGVFLYPGDLSETLMDLCYKLYRKNVAVIKFRQWQFGDDRLIIGQKTGMLDVVDVYSGVSKEIDRLIEQKKESGVLNHQQKNEVLSVFDRLYEQLMMDFGLVGFYYPQVDGGVELLSSLQNLV